MFLVSFVSYNGNLQSSFREYNLIIIYWNGLSISLQIGFMADVEHQHSVSHYPQNPACCDLISNTLLIGTTYPFPMPCFSWYYPCLLMCSFLAGNEQLILTAVIRHLDRKNVSRDVQTKSDIIQTATSLARQLRSRGYAAELVVAGDLCKHLRKTLEAVELGSVEDLNLNESLQHLLEDCLMEVVRGVCPYYSAQFLYWYLCFPFLS